MPKIFEIDGRIFFDVSLDKEATIREAYRAPDSMGRSKTEQQKAWNSLNIRETFLVTDNNPSVKHKIHFDAARDVILDASDFTSNTTLANIAELIKHNWEYHLQKQYPDKKFGVEIYGDSFDPYITFWQVD